MKPVEWTPDLQSPHSIVHRHRTELRISYATSSYIAIQATADEIAEHALLLQRFMMVLTC